MEHQFMNSQKTFEADYESNNLIQDIADGVKLVGQAATAVGKVFKGIFGTKKADPATNEFQQQLLTARNTLLVQPDLKISDILTFNDLIRTNFQALDQAKLHASGMGPYYYFIYPKGTSDPDGFYRSDRNISASSVTFHDLAILKQGTMASMVNVDTFVSDADIAKVAAEKNMQASQVTNTSTPGNPVLTAGSSQITWGTYALIGLFLAAIIFFAIKK
jgi:hypothetical protein